jgi:hypothetical protein
MILGSGIVTRPGGPTDAGHKSQRTRVSQTAKDPLADRRQIAGRLGEKMRPGARRRGA